MDRLMDLLFEAIAGGLRVTPHGERLVVRGPQYLEPLALELLAHKAELLALLQERPELAELDPFTARVAHIFDGDIVAGGEGREWGAATSFSRASTGASHLRGRREGGGRG